jgi:hypothetical protein
LEVWSSRQAWHSAGPRTTNRSTLDPLVGCGRRSSQRSRGGFCRRRSSVWRQDTLHHRRVLGSPPPPNHGADYRPAQFSGGQRPHDKCPAHLEGSKKAIQGRRYLARVLFHAGGARGLAPSSARVDTKRSRARQVPNDVWQSNQTSGPKSSCTCRRPRSHSGRFAGSHARPAQVNRRRWADDPGGQRAIP